MDSYLEDFEPPKSVSLWRANHGNWLLGLTLAIVLIGSSILMFGSDHGASLGADGRFQESGETGARIDEDATASDGIRLTIKVPDAVSDEGQMMLAVYDTANQFNDPTLAILKSPRPIKKGIATWVIAAKNLPSQFAVAAYHDKNSDGILNRSMFGIPAEPYGFSNQARGNFGPPSFEQAVLLRPTKDESIEIHLGTAIQFEAVPAKSK
jgi:uncharacterized protein (DUF2141 family)